MSTARDSLAEVAPSGAFTRSPSTFLDAPGASPAFPVETGRYALYISMACPWACRVLAALTLKQYEPSFVTVVLTCPTWVPTSPAQDSHCGWGFRCRAVPGSVDAGLEEVPLVDPFFKAHTVRELYTTLCQEAGIEPPSKFTVPLLVDVRARRIVCNESSILLRALGGLGPCNALSGAPALDLCPAPLLPAIEAANTAMYSAFNNGVYRCGFATAQAPYSEAAAEVAAYLDSTEQLLAGQRYLCGQALTEADIRLYVTLVRYDPVYVVHFKCAFRTIRALPALSAYLRDVHSVLHPQGRPAHLPRLTSLLHIKQHYFGSHPKLNPYGIVPAPHPGEEDFEGK